MDFFTLASSSSGNCSFLGSDKTRILIDAGLSRKRMLEALLEKGIALSDIDAVLITHEHRDHIGGLGVLMRKHDIPIYGTPGTIEAIKASSVIGDVDFSQFREIVPGQAFEIGDLCVNSHPISHDAAEPCAYRIDCCGSSIGIVTDLGTYNEELIDRFSGLSAILLEANHDIRMLETGVYPYQLKRRIASDIGHLSNEDSGKLLSRLLHDNLKWVLLGHLSEENNYDKLAKESVGLEITLAECPYRASDFKIEIAHRKEPYDLLKL